MKRGGPKSTCVKLVYWFYHLPLVWNKTIKRFNEERFKS